LWIARTKADGLLLGRDKLLYRPGHEFAPAESRYRKHPITIERDHGFVFANGLFEPLLRTPHLGFGEMRERPGRESCQGSLGERFRTSDVGSRRLAHLIMDAACESCREPTLRLKGRRIELQCAPEPTDRFGVIVARTRLRHSSASTENAVDRVGMLCRPGRLPADQLDIKRDGDPTRDLVLQSEQIARITVKLLGPQMRISLSVDQLGIDADFVTRPPDAPFEYT
jgi:hypothetical protein